MQDSAPSNEEEKKEKPAEVKEKPKEQSSKEMYGADVMKFGNSSIRGAKGSASPMIGGAF